MKICRLRLGLGCACVLGTLAIWMSLHGSLRLPARLAHTQSLSEGKQAGVHAGAIQSPHSKPLRADLGGLTPGANSRLVASYRKLPLSFEANAGQADSQVKFLSRGRGYTLFLTGNQAVLKLERASQMSNGKSQMASGKNENRPLPLVTRSLKVAKDGRSAAKDQGQMTKDSVLRMRLVGANVNATVTGTEELPGRSNYFIGNDPKKWRTNVPNYAKVKYAGVYPGVDLVYYGNQGGQLEYDFVVAPGADPSIITLDVGAGLAPPSYVRNRGLVASKSAHAPKPTKRAGQAPPLQIAANGDLLVKTNGGEIRFHKPVVYQSESTVIRQSSIDNRQFLPSRYTLDAQDRVGFHVAPYDHSKPLFIDPVLSYSTYLGGSGVDYASGIVVDSSGNAFVAGTTQSTNFPSTSGAYDAAAHGGMCVNGSPCGDVFVAKLNASGSALVYSTYLGGSSDETAGRIAIDSADNAYVTGTTSSTDFPTVNPVQPNYGGGEWDAFVTKLNAAGSALVYSTYLGGNNADFGWGIAVDSAGNAYVSVQTESTNFPTAHPFQANYGGGLADVAVAKLNTAGSALVYSTYLGGTSADFAGDIAVDSSGNAYVTGCTNSTDFPTANPLQAKYAGGFWDAFVAKLNPAGSSLVYSTYLGGSRDDCGSGIAVDSSGSAYLAGQTCSNDFPTVNAIQSTYGGGACSPEANGDAFVAKLNPAGLALTYSTYLGGSSDDGAFAIAIDSADEAYVTGYTQSTNFPTVNAVQTTNNAGPTAGNQTGFVAKLNATGSALVYSTYLGGSIADGARGIAVDSSGNAYVTGDTQSTNFPIVNAVQASYGGGTDDAFVAELSLADLAGVSLTPSSLTFPNQVVGTTSSAQTATLLNVGSAALTISSIVASGDFAQTNTCDAGIAGATSCRITVTFAPTATGTRTGVITITDNAAGSPHMIDLTGTGVGPAVTPSPTSLTFPAQVDTTASAAQTITLTNSGNATLNITALSIAGANAGDFMQTNTCGSSVAAGANCAINVTFTPTAGGSRSGTLAITDNASGSPQTVALSGTGEDFTVTASSASMTVTAGGTATYTASVNPLGGFNQPVALTCTEPGTLTLSTCLISPTSVTPNGTSAVSATVTVTTTAGTMVAPRRLGPPISWLGLRVWTLILVCFLVLGTGMAVARRRRWSWLILTGSVLLVIVWSGCGGGGGSVVHNPGTPAGTYTLTVTGTFTSGSASLIRTQNLTLTVN